MTYLLSALALISLLSAGFAKYQLEQNDLLSQDLREYEVKTDRLGTSLKREKASRDREVAALEQSMALLRKKTKQSQAQAKKLGEALNEAENQACLNSPLPDDVLDGLYGKSSQGSNRDRIRPEGAAKHPPIPLPPR